VPRSVIARMQCARARCARKGWGVSGGLAVLAQDGGTHLDAGELSRSLALLELVRFEASGAAHHLPWHQVYDASAIIALDGHKLGSGSRQKHGLGLLGLCFVLLSCVVHCRLQLAFSPLAGLQELLELRALTLEIALARCAYSVVEGD
jgi:hypothetical protein